MPDLLAHLAALDAELARDLRDADAATRIGHAIRLYREGRCERLAYGFEANRLTRALDDCYEPLLLV